MRIKSCLPNVVFTVSLAWDAAFTGHVCVILPLCKSLKTFNKQSPKGTLECRICNVSKFLMPTSNDWLVNSANQMRLKKRQLLQQRPAPFSRNTDMTATSQRHFLNSAWPRNLQRDRALTSILLPASQNGSIRVPIPGSAGARSLSGALQLFAIIKARESPWRIGFLQELVLGGDSWDNLQKQFRAISFDSVAPPSQECY